jgi:hypothetical protein
MRRACALLGLLVLTLVACGKYGPPVRTRPAPPATPTEAAEPAETADPDADEQEESQ